MGGDEGGWKRRRGGGTRRRPQTGTTFTPGPNTVKTPDGQRIELIPFLASVPNINKGNGSFPHLVFTSKFSYLEDKKTNHGYEYF